MSEIDKIVKRIHDREIDLHKKIEIRDERWQKVWDHLTEKGTSGEFELRQQLNSMRLIYIMTYIQHGWNADIVIKMVDELIG